MSLSSLRGALCALLLIATFPAHAADADRAFLEEQYRILVQQRQELAQMGADPQSLAALDQSLANLRRAIDGQQPVNQGAASGGFAVPNYGQNSGSNANQPYDPNAWIKTYNPVGPNGQDCTPFYDAKLNRYLVPGGCPMPSSGGALPPRPSATTLPKYDLKPLPKGVPQGGALPGGGGQVWAPAPPKQSTRTPGPKPKLSAPKVPVLQPMVAPRSPSRSDALPGSDTNSAPARLALPLCGEAQKLPCRTTDGKIIGG
jgi:hypothetical protein